MVCSFEVSKAWHRSNRLHAWMLGTSVLAMVVGGSAYGQTAGNAQANNATVSSGTIEEVVVTAQQRVQNLQDVAVSAEVVPAEQMAALNLNSLSDIANLMPSVQIETAGRTSLMFIRGIGSQSNPSFDQEVGMFVDDVYHGRSRIALGDSLDLERVEVLKGPQTTYFGNNAIAGAFNIVTARPTDDFEAWGRVLGGSFDTYAAEGAVSGPITDTLDYRVALSFNGMQGWVTNVGDNNKMGPEQDNVGGRVSLLYRPNDKLSVLFKVEQDSNMQHGLPLSINECPPSAPFPKTGVGYCALALLPHSPANPNGGLPLDQSRVTSEGPGQLIRLDTTDAVLTVNYDLGGPVLTSVTGFYHYDYDLRLNNTVTPTPQINSSVPENYSQESQEFRIASPTGQEFEYLAGVYAQNDNLTSSTFESVPFATPRLLGPLAPLAAYAPLAIDEAFTQDEQSYSAFGALTWNVTNELSATGALRGTIVHKGMDMSQAYGEGASNQYEGFAAPLPASLTPLANAVFRLSGLSNFKGLERTDRAIMSSGRLQYRPDEHVMAYVSFTRGFLAGGFNGVDTSDNAANLPFKPEYVDDWEAGVKSEWFGQRLLLNANLFREYFRDLQVGVNQSNGSVFVSKIENAASAISKGVELEATGVITDEFRLGTNVTYTNSYYINYQNALPTVAQELAGLQNQNLSGRPQPLAPLWAGNVTATYDMPIWGGYHFISQVIDAFSSGFWVFGSDDPVSRQKAFSTLEARLTLQSPDGHWAVDLIGSNLTNQKIFIFDNTSNQMLGSTAVSYREPINFSGQIRFNW